MLESVSILIIQELVHDIVVLTKVMDFMMLTALMQQCLFSLMLGVQLVPCHANNNVRFDNNIIYTQNK